MSVLAILAFTTLTGPLRGAVLLLFAGLGVKVWIAELKRKQEASEENSRRVVGSTGEGEEGTEGERANEGGSRPD